MLMSSIDQFVKEIELILYICVGTDSDVSLHIGRRGLTHSHSTHAPGSWDTTTEAFGGHLPLVSVCLSASVCLSGRHRWDTQLQDMHRHMCCEIFLLLASSDNQT